MSEYEASLLSFWLLRKQRTEPSWPRPRPSPKGPCPGPACPRRTAAQQLWEAWGSPGPRTPGSRPTSSLTSSLALPHPTPLHLPPWPSWGSSSAHWSGPHLGAVHLLFPPPRICLRLSRPLCLYSQVTCSVRSSRVTRSQVSTSSGTHTPCPASLPAVQMPAPIWSRSSEARGPCSQRVPSTPSPGPKNTLRENFLDGG